MSSAPEVTELSVADARSRVLQEVRPLAVEEVSLLDAAGRVLAEDLVAPRDLPPWDNSQMDGFAVRAEDLRTGEPLTIVETVLAGGFPAKTVGAGQAIRIMTGAPMPGGADAVVPVEAVAVEGSTVRVTGRAPVRGDFVRARGEDVREGSVAVTRGTLLSPAAIGVAASLGRDRLRVHRKPVVAVVATGDELADPGEDAGPRRIYASSSFALAAAIRRAGGDARYHGIARDTREDLHAKLSAALRGADVLLTTGGVSVGDADYVKEVLAALGVRMIFWRVAQKPGYPLAFGIAGATLVFGLPGNPVSTMVSWEEYVLPAVLAMQGRGKRFAPVIDAALEEPLKANGERHQFLRAIVSGEHGRWTVRTTGSQSSGMLTSLLHANALLLVPPKQAALAAGATVKVQLLDPDFFTRFDPGFW